MPNTYTQLYIQLVFAVKHREALISEPIRDHVQKYLTGITQKNGHKMLSVFCMPDHTHVFVGLNPNQSISDLVNDLKTYSSGWINKEKLSHHHFNWQNGYGAFSYHKKLIPVIGKYIDNQKAHHQNESFQTEYLNLLNEFDVDYQDQYLFEFFDT